MRKIGLALFAALTAVSVAGSALADTKEDTPSLFGVWRNPKNTVHVEIKPCGSTACGYVVWATAKAQADAKKGSGKALIGMQLFQSLKPDKNGAVWRGRVYVPDMNRTFSGATEVVGVGSLRAKGCLFASVLCKSQMWTRVAEATD